MTNRRWYFLLLFILILGFLLRLNHYDQTPGWRESDDEVHYAWGGWTWITNGIPTSWSYNESYTQSQTITVWGTPFRMVTPNLDKPPLYYLLSGGLLKLSGADTYADARLSMVRILPIVLSVATIALTGLVAGRVFSPAVGLLAALLMAVSPSAILAHRLNLTENLLTPLMLLGNFVMLLKWKFDKLFSTNVLLLGIIAGLAVLTKQTGIAVYIGIIGIFLYQKNWRGALVVTCIFALFAVIYPLIGLFYDWNLFVAVNEEFRRIGLQGGLPEVIYTLLGRPIITTEKWFPEGTLLLGYILLLASPWFLLSPERKKSPEPLYTFLIFPFVYLTILVLTLTGAEKIGSGQALWGWYLFPLYPAAFTLVAYVLHQLYLRFHVLTALVLGIVLGSGSIRFVFLSLPRGYHYLWQYGLIAVVFSLVGVHFLKGKYQKIALLVFIALYAVINLYTSLQLSEIYGSSPQPLH